MPQRDRGAVVHAADLSKLQFLIVPIVAGIGRQLQTRPTSMDSSFPSMPQSPFVSNSPYTVATTAPPWSVEKPAEQPSVNQELIQAVRKAFPDPAGLPPELKDILDKTESSEMKKITTDLHKSTAALGRARKQLQELQEAKSQHRANWVQHLNASLDAWQKQTEAFDKQQVQYSTLIQQATIELHAARNSIQQLNAKAAQDRNLESLLEEAPVLQNISTQPSWMRRRRSSERRRRMCFPKPQKQRYQLQKWWILWKLHPQLQCGSGLSNRLVGKIPLCRVVLHERWQHCFLKVKKTVVFSGVEAYGNDCCAACTSDSTVLAPPSIMHSVIFEDLRMTAFLILQLLAVLNCYTAKS